VRTSFSGRDIAQKAVARSRDWGCKGHQILRRVLVGGRHLGLSRASFFHETLVTATLAASSRRTASVPRKGIRRRQVRQREGAPAVRRNVGRGDRGVRGSTVSGHRGDNKPTLESSRVTQGARDSTGKAVCVHRRSAEAFASAVKHSVPW
jgi:hypothetical protein